MKRDTKAPKPGPAMTAREVADYLKLHFVTVHRLIKTAGLPGFRLGSDWRFWPADIDKWIQGQHARSGESEPPEGRQQVKRKKPAPRNKRSRKIRP